MLVEKLTYLHLHNFLDKIKSHGNRQDSSSLRVTVSKEGMLRQLQTYLKTSPVGAVDGAHFHYKRINTQTICRLVHLISSGSIQLSSLEVNSWACVNVYSLSVEGIAYLERHEPEFTWTCKYQRHSKSSSCLDYASDCR